jgi:hypothetical protein
MYGYSKKKKVFEVTMFPRNVEDKLAELGFQKSKKGNYYKIYRDSEEEILVIPNCRRNRDGMRAVDWYCKFNNQDRRIIYVEAADLSKEFDADSEQIHKLIPEYDY